MVLALILRLRFIRVVVDFVWIREKKDGDSFFMVAGIVKRVWLCSYEENLDYTCYSYLYFEIEEFR